MKNILIIQTAFIGDVILATVLIEALKDKYPDASVDFLLRKGSEQLLKEHPKLNEVLIWDKRKHKYANLIKMMGLVRKRRYDLIVNVHRFSSSGLICLFSGAGQVCGFDKNPLSGYYQKKVEHEIGNGLHETIRNLKLIEHLGISTSYKPKLYISKEDERRVAEINTGKYVTIAPASVWFTKQFPHEKWVELIKNIPDEMAVYFLGSGNDIGFCERIMDDAGHSDQHNLAGKLTMLESAALMKGAVMNFVNDSAPMHLASAVNAPVTAIYCSTVPDFGFGPLSDNSRILQNENNLPCRPCGLHGFRSCPEGHFKCALDIKIPERVIN